MRREPAVRQVDLLGLYEPVGPVGRPGAQGNVQECGIHSAGDLAKSDRFGHVLETFVVGELRKMSGWSKLVTGAYHFRTEKAREVDIVLENPAGRVVGIEVKASASIGSDDLIGLKQLREICGSKWVRGIVLHSGPGITGFDKDLHAVPMSALWSW